MYQDKGKILLIILIIIGLILWGIFLVKELEEKNFNKTVKFGVTFSKGRAKNLNLNWKETYSAILDELNVKSLRLGAYWPEIQPSENIYDFTDLDWQIKEAKKYNADIILVVGQKLPGWPECHIPDWAQKLNKEKQQRRLLSLIKKTINRYKDQKNIIAWQVENEPFLSKFGICSRIDKKFFKKELDLVHSLDERPIIVSESGELSTWINGAHYGDILGITIYRAVWNKYFKYLYYPFPAIAYYFKWQIIKFLTNQDKIIVVELQGEPWSPNGQLSGMSFEEQNRTMSFKKFKNVIKYAQQTGLSKFYLWGAEWWYWLKENGHVEMWNYAKTIFK